MTGLRVPNAWLTPAPGRQAPVHRWFVFPHSFAPELVTELLDTVAVRRGSSVLDPFCGAGTTLIQAQRNGYQAIGADLLPLALLAAESKTNPPSAGQLREAKKVVDAAIAAAVPVRSGPELLARSFTPMALGRLIAARDALPRTKAGRCARLATLAASPSFSKLVANGGWLRRTEPALPSRRVSQVVTSRLQQMIDDVRHVDRGQRARVICSDARRLPLDSESVQAVITSPPYPNRHDYTRVFAVELELGFELGEHTKDLRHSTLHSHPEARPMRRSDAYPRPAGLTRAISRVNKRATDHRIPRMLDGYFHDMYEVLCEVARVLDPQGRAALVVGNARYAGVNIPVDRYIAQLGLEAGFRVEGRYTLRWRGNSAQQMAQYGRSPAREAVVLLRRNR